MKSESITLKCPRCGEERDNPRAVHPPGGFISIHLTTSPEMCDECRALEPRIADGTATLCSPPVREARGWAMSPPRWFVR